MANTTQKEQTLIPKDALQEAQPPMMEEKTLKRRVFVPSFTSSVLSACSQKKIKEEQRMTHRFLKAFSFDSFLWWVSKLVSGMTGMHLRQRSYWECFRETLTSSIPASLSFSTLSPATQIDVITVLPTKALLRWTKGWRICGATPG